MFGLLSTAVLPTLHVTALSIKQAFRALALVL